MKSFFVLLMIVFSFALFACDDKNNSVDDSAPIVDIVVDADSTPAADDTDTVSSDTDAVDSTDVDAADSTPDVVTTEDVSTP